MHVFVLVFGFGVYVKAIKGFKACFSFLIRFRFGLYMKWPYAETKTKHAQIGFYCFFGLCSNHARLYPAPHSIVLITTTLPNNTYIFLDFVSGVGTYV